MQSNGAPTGLGLSNLHSAIHAPAKPVHRPTSQYAPATPPQTPKAAFKASPSNVHPENAADRAIKPLNLCDIKNIAIPTPLRKPSSILMDGIVKTTVKNPFVNPCVNNDNYPGLQQGPKVLPEPKLQAVAEPVVTVVPSAAKLLNRRPTLSMLSKTMAQAKSNASAVAEPATQPPSPVQPAMPPSTPVEPATLPAAAIEPSLPATKQLQNWTRPFPIEEGKFIKAVVQYVCPETYDICWVMLSEHEVECNKLLKGIHRAVGTSTPSCQPNDIQLNQLYAAPFEEVYYRAVCIEPLNAINEVKFRLVDYGNEFYANLEDVKKPIPLMCNLHAFAFKIRFNNDRVGVLSIGTELSIIVLCEPDQNGIYSVMEEAVSAAAPIPVPEVVSAPAPVAILPATPQSVVQEEIFTLDNIEVVPIPTNTNCKLYLWDLSDINDGIITAGIFNIEKIKRIEQHLCSEMDAYCKNLDIKEYVPQVGELCLTVFELDSKWYRAVCIEEESAGGIKLLYVDYGNITNAPRKDVRPISQEFLIPTLANTCHISGNFVLHK